MIRVGTADDAAGAAAVMGRAFPDRVETAAGLAHSIARRPPRARSSCAAAEVDGAIVGWGWAALDWLSTTPTDAFVGVVVEPGHRRRGIGSALWDVLAEHLDVIGARTVRSFGDDDVGGFAEPRGFRRTDTAVILSLELARLPTPAPLSRGVAVEPWTAFAGDLRRIYEVDFATLQDEPGDHDLGAMSFEDWHRDTLDHPDFDPSLSGVLVVDGEPVGTALVFADHASGRIASGGLGVLAAQRGRGLGRALKWATLSRARAAGLTLAFTGNDETNAAMLAINRGLGYAPFATRAAWRRG